MNISKKSLVVIVTIALLFAGCARVKKELKGLSQDDQLPAGVPTTSQVPSIGQVELLNEQGITLVVRRDGMSGDQALLQLEADISPEVCSKASVSWDGPYKGKSAIRPNNGGGFGQSDTIAMSASAKPDVRAIIVAVKCQGRKGKPDQTACKGGLGGNLYCRKASKFVFRAKVVVNDPILATFRQWTDGKECKESSMLKGHWQAMHECMPL